MLALIQRVKNASVTIKGKKISRISAGICVFLGVRSGDNDQDIKYIIQRLTSLRIFSEGEGKFIYSFKNFPVAKPQPQILVVSQFTLYADLKRGTKPSFTQAMPPAPALELYRRFCAQLSDLGYTVSTGEFGAYMDVELINDGPVTFIMSSDQLPHHDANQV